MVDLYGLARVAVCCRPSPHPSNSGGGHGLPARLGFPLRGCVQPSAPLAGAGLGHDIFVAAPDFSHPC